VTPASKRGSETRDRILTAALETVRTEGFANTTARAIAAQGGFNQALIFYHFGSVDELLDEAFGRVSEQQVARYREAVQELGSLTDLVQIARRPGEEGLDDGTQLGEADRLHGGSYAAGRNWPSAE